jgi:hypothetical protein
LVALFALASLKGAFRMNWTTPAFLSLLPGAAAMLLEVLDRGLPVWTRCWRWAVGVTVGTCAIMVVFGHLGMATKQLDWLSYLRLGGWSQLAERVKDKRAALEAATGQKPFLLGADKYRFAAELGFYLHESRDCVNLFALGEHGVGYRYWTDLAGFAGRPAVIVLGKSTKSDKLKLEKLRPYFAKLDPPELVRIYSSGRLQREVYLVAGYGYRYNQLHPSDPE